MKTKFISLTTLLMLLAIGAPGHARPCVETTAAYDQMDTITIRVGKRQLSAKLADTNFKRASGMQHLCPESIARMPMLFLLPRPYRAAFHMNNVHAPLDIAFLDADGTVLEIRRMGPGERLGASQATSAALEAAAGSFAEWDLQVGDRIEWDTGNDER